ncbi:MAG: hypothetical protein DI536_06700 [Archangium gephyra]|uniref:LysR substrate-binding domain-containing protein n=1 Tax=Archangium gephyra TaxID=48 RepID=A0A2W5TU68_9BACT|nr:MAG: hypothetical protein DI536_06700 [Archangium gephyra]
MFVGALLFDCRCAALKIASTRGRRAFSNVVNAQAGLRRTIAVTVPSFAAVASVVSSTDLLGGMPRRTAELYARAMPLQLLSGLGPTLRFEMFLHWHERTHRDAAHVAFRRVIAAALQDRHSREAASH